MHSKGIQMGSLRHFVNDYTREKKRKYCVRGVVAIVATVFFNCLFIDELSAHIQNETFLAIGQTAVIALYLGGMIFLSTKIVDLSEANPENMKKLGFAMRASETVRRLVFLGKSYTMTNAAAEELYQIALNESSGEYFDFWSKHDPELSWPEVSQKSEGNAND